MLATIETRKRPIGGGWQLVVLYGGRIVDRFDLLSEKEVDAAEEQFFAALAHSLGAADALNLELPVPKGERWSLLCLICDQEFDDLVACQEHAMEEHGYDQEDRRNSTRVEVKTDHYRWSMPDGIEWMEARRVRY